MLWPCVEVGIGMPAALGAAIALAAFTGLHRWARAGLTRWARDTAAFLAIAVFALTIGDAYPWAGAISDVALLTLGASLFIAARGLRQAFAWAGEADD